MALSLEELEQKEREGSLLPVEQQQLNQLRANDEAMFSFMPPARDMMPQRAPQPGQGQVMPQPAAPVGAMPPEAPIAGSQRELAGVGMSPQASMGGGQPLISDESGMMKWATLLAPFIGMLGGAAVGGKRGAAMGLLGGTKFTQGYDTERERQRTVGQAQETARLEQEFRKVRTDRLRKEMQPLEPVKPPQVYQSGNVLLIRDPVTRGVERLVIDDTLTTPDGKTNLVTRADKAFSEKQYDLAAMLYERAGDKEGAALAARHKTPQVSEGAKFDLKADTSLAEVSNQIFQATGERPDRMEIQRISDYDSAVLELDLLTKQLEENAASLGPGAGRIASLNPYDTAGQSLQADIKSVKQLVGKALEGGVLRKEDEEKYNMILPTLNDTVQVALNKSSGLSARMRRARILYLQNMLQGKAGIDTKYAKVSFEETGPGVAVPGTPVKGDRRQLSTGRWVVFDGTQWGIE